MPAPARQQDTSGLATDKGKFGEDTDNADNAPSAAEVDVADVADASPGVYRVLTGAMTVASDKDGKKVQRYLRGQKVTLGDHHEIDRLLALRMVEPWGTKSQSIGPSSALHVARAANQANQENVPYFEPDGDPETPTGEQLADASS